MGQKVKVEDMKKCLEEAGMYEENMSREQVEEYYNVIRASQTTASADEKRRLTQSQEELIEALDKSINESSTSMFVDKDKPSTSKAKEKPFTAKKWLSKKEVPSENLHTTNDSFLGEELISEDPEDMIQDLIDNPDSQNLNDSIKDATKIMIGFNDMPESTDTDMLPIIHHKLKFVGIQNSSNFLTATQEERTKLLYFYHIALARIKNKLAKNSRDYAPLPKPITCTHLEESVLSIVKDKEDDLEETYVSRSGRQTKRKVYNYDEDESSQEAVSHKKVKNNDEREWFSKSTPTKTTRTKKSESLNSELSETENATVTLENSESIKQKENKPTLKPRLNKYLTNNEIMQRSSLFNDSIKKTRAESMFDNLKEEDEKKRKSEKVMEVFNKTLETIDEDPSADDVMKVEEQECVKRRVNPPIPGRRAPITCRKAINNRKRKDALDPLPISTSPGPKKSATNRSNSTEEKQENKSINGIPKKNMSLRRTPKSENRAEPSTSRTTTKAETVPCPICSMLFAQDLVEEHAATCGEDVISQSSRKIPTLVCNICDKVMLLTTEYEVHVKDCLERHRS